MHARAPQPLRRRFGLLTRVAVVLSLAAFVAWEGLQGRFSTASHASILGAIAATLLLALVSGLHRQRKDSRISIRDATLAPGRLVAGVRGRSPTSLGALVWALLIVATIGWDVVSFVAQRHSLPTLSRLFGDVTDHDWGRAIVFALWLVLGLYLATGWRRAKDEVRTSRPGSSRRARLPVASPTSKEGDR
jgi:hypothetical protein